MSAVLVEGDGVLQPGPGLQHEVDGDLLPVVIVAVVHAERVAALLVAVPHVPGQLQHIFLGFSANIFGFLNLEKVPALRDVVIDGRLGVELLALAVVGVGGLVREAVVISRAVKAEQGPVLDSSNMVITNIIVIMNHDH